MKARMSKVIKNIIKDNLATQEDSEEYNSLTNNYEEEVKITYNNKKYTFTSKFPEHLLNKNK